MYTSILKHALMRVCVWCEPNSWYFIMKMSSQQHSFSVFCFSLTSLRFARFLFIWSFITSGKKKKLRLTFPLFNWDICLCFLQLGMQQKKVHQRRIFMICHTVLGFCLWGFFGEWGGGLKWGPFNYACSFQHRCRSRREGKINSGPYGVQTRGFGAKRN